MPKVTFLPEGKTIEAPAGSTVMEAAVLAGLQPDAPCGGRGLCGKCGILVDGKSMPACKTVVAEDMTVRWDIRRGYNILKDGLQTDCTPDGTDEYCLAFDVGTTTVVGYLLDGKSGAILAREGKLNPQAQYGADVISRIQAAMSGKADALRGCVCGCMNEILTELSAQAGILPSAVTRVSVAGNTGMHHLLLGIDPASLVTPPYMPAICEAMQMPAAKLFPALTGAELRVLPNIAGFVGADTVACLTATRLDRVNALTLLADIGTNGEMVLSDGKRRVACSAAAGPAFEGAKISRGMRADPGAVDHIWIENGGLRFHTIGDAAPIGICGSGLLDISAALLELGVMDETGRLEDGEYTIPGIDISVTQADIRQLQMTKAAIRAGIRLLCEHMGCGEEDIQTLLLAGAFGNYLDPSSACRIGMFPAALRDRVISVGNAAGEGARLCVLSRDKFAYAGDLAEGTEFLELASKPVFQDRFVDALEFGEDIYDDL